MRLKLSLFLSIALAAAGCLGGDDEAPAETAEPSPTAPTPTTPAGSALVPVPTEDENVTAEPAKPAPREVHTDAHDFAAAPAPDPANPTGATSSRTIKPFTVPAGYTTLAVTVTFTPGPAPVGIGQAPTVELLDAAGSALGSCTATIPLQAAEECTIDSGAIAPGDFALGFSGFGTLAATVSVTAA